MRRALGKRIAAGAVTAVLGAALALPALGVAAPTPRNPLTVKPGVSAVTGADIAIVHVQAAGEAAVAAEVRLAAEQATQAATKTAAYAGKKSSSKAAARPKGSESGRAQAILAALKARYPRYLNGVTVKMGSARGYQAISYYTTGQIIVSPTHRATLERILGHEIWHIIDWRDNHHIDWGERIPPANASSYR